MAHLTERTYAQLVAGTLPPGEARELAAHLEGDCAECEAFLGARPGADALDGRADRALGALAPEGLPGNDLEFARIERRMAGRTPRPPRRQLLPAALAAGLLAAGIAGLVVQRPERPAWDGVKGTSARPIPARLRFLVVAGDAARPRSLEQGVSGEVVPAGASLQFEVETGRPAAVALVRVPSRGAPEVVWRERVGPGRTPVTVDGQPAAYPLAELSGPQRFVLIASDAPLDEAGAARLAAPLAPPAPAGVLGAGRDGVALDVVEIEVR